MSVFTTASSSNAGDIAIRSGTALTEDAVFLANAKRLAPPRKRTTPYSKFLQAYAVVPTPAGMHRGAFTSNAWKQLTPEQQDSFGTNNAAKAQAKAAKDAEREAAKAAKAAEREAAKALLKPKKVPCSFILYLNATRAYYASILDEANAEVGDGLPVQQKDIVALASSVWRDADSAELRDLWADRHEQAKHSEFSDRQRLIDSWVETA